MTATQLTLDIQEARKERDRGMQKAINHANTVNKDWLDKAYKMFKEWLSGWVSGHEFMIEDFRFSAEIKGLERPPSARSYGAIAVKAKKENLIISYETGKTRGKTAHRANANKWIKV